MDIYLNKENLDSLPEEPDESFYVGSLDLQQHKLLSKFFNEFKIFGVDFPFFDDFILKHDDILMLKTIVENNPSFIHDSEMGKDSYSLLLKTLTLSTKEKCGVMGFAD